MKPSSRVFIIMLGPPGVGKGVYSSLLTKDLGINCLSSGDELRRIIRKEDPSSIPINELKQTMINGKLVNDSYILSHIFGKLNTPKYAKGAILDGFPRTIIQAKVFESFTKINLVVKIDLDEDIIIKKMLGRRHCFYCSKSYNDCAIKEGEYDLPKMLPIKQHDKCDRCNKTLKFVKREDDNEVSIRKRIRIYKNMTKPVEDYYKNHVTLFQPKKGLKDYPAFYNWVKSTLH